MEHRDGSNFQNDVLNTYGGRSTAVNPIHLIDMAKYFINLVSTSSDYNFGESFPHNSSIPQTENSKIDTTIKEQDERKSQATNASN
jgi:hypothetical protein